MISKSLVRYAVSALATHPASFRSSLSRHVLKTCADTQKATCSLAAYSSAYLSAQRLSPCRGMHKWDPRRGLCSLRWIPRTPVHSSHCTPFNTWKASTWRRPRPATIPPRSSATMLHAGSHTKVGGDRVTNSGNMIQHRDEQNSRGSDALYLPEEPAWPASLTVGTNITLAEATRVVASWLDHCKVDDPAPSAAELLAKAAGFRSPQEMLAKRPASATATLSESQWDMLQELCEKRAVEHVPVQYLVGEWDFHMITLEMQPPTLIPRPETEELVEHILKWLSRGEIASAGYLPGDDGSLRFLDVGAGTGAIGLALLKALPGATCVAIDVQRSAVELSNRNAQRNGLQDRYTCFQVDVTSLGRGTSLRTPTAGARVTIATIDGEATKKDSVHDEGLVTEVDMNDAFDFIVSNPPYIPRRDMADLPPEVSEHEDNIALDGGEDGLDVVREIVRTCPRLLKRGGFRKLWMEVDTSHPERIQSWLGFGSSSVEDRVVVPRESRQPRDETHGVTAFEWRKDMSQRPRFVELTFADINTRAS